MEPVSTSSAGSSLPPLSLGEIPSFAPSVAESPTGSAAPSPIRYVVQSGDTLSLIADRFGADVEAIRAANGLSSDVINIGQVLIIP